MLPCPMINTECPKLNPAKFAAFQQAERRAESERLPMFIFVGPAGSGCLNAVNDCNVWFVRSEAEGVPEGATLYHTQDLS